MRLDNPTEQMANAMYTDMAKNGYNYPTNYSRIFHFTQEWGSTSLGFGGMGGASMTTAMTSVFMTGNNWSVYFGGRHAYDLVSPNQLFRDDLSRHSMKSVSDSVKYK